MHLLFHPGWAVALAILGAYLMGSIPFGVLFARGRGVDLKKVGSGNIGATNVARALGKRIGVVVLLCDAAKGFAPVFLCKVGLEPRLAHGTWLTAAVGFAAFLGHLAPVWLGFRGGKGVATGGGIFLALSPPAVLMAVLGFVLTYTVTRLASLGSLVATTLLIPALHWAGADGAYLADAGGMWLLIVIKHRPNIERLIRREEPRT